MRVNVRNKYSITGYTEDDYEYYRPGPPESSAPLMWRNIITGETGIVDEYGNKVGETSEKVYQKPSIWNLWSDSVNQHLNSWGNKAGQWITNTFVKPKNSKILINGLKSDEQKELEWLQRNNYIKYVDEYGNVKYYDNALWSNKFVDTPDMSKDRFSVRAFNILKKFADIIDFYKPVYDKQVAIENKVSEWATDKGKEIGKFNAELSKANVKDILFNTYVLNPVKKFANIIDFFKPVYDKQVDIGNKAGKWIVNTGKKNFDAFAEASANVNVKDVLVDTYGKPAYNKVKSIKNRFDDFVLKTSDTPDLKDIYYNTYIKPIHDKQVNIGNKAGRWIANTFYNNNDITKNYYERQVHSGGVTKYYAEGPKNKNEIITVSNPLSSDNQEKTAENNKEAISNSYKTNNGKVDNTKFLDAVKEYLTNKWNSLSNLNNENGNKGRKQNTTKKSITPSIQSEKKDSNTKGFTGFALELAKKFGWVKDDTSKQSTTDNLLKQSTTDSYDSSSQTNTSTYYNNQYGYLPSTVGYDYNNIIGSSNGWTNVGSNTQYSNWIAPVTNTVAVRTTTDIYGDKTQIVRTNTGNEYSVNSTKDYVVPVITDGRIVYRKASGKGTEENKPMARFGMGPGAIANAARYAIKRGYKERNGGTHPKFFKDYFAKNGMGSQTTSSRSQLIRNIKAGHPTVLMGKDSRGTSRNNPYGRNPHYVTATGVDRNGHVIIQDPQSKYNNQLYSMGDVMNKTSFGVSAFGRGTGLLRKLGCGKGCKHAACGKYGRGKFGRGTNRIIFVGDSRFCQMYNYKFGGSSGEYVNVKDDNGDIWSSKGGEALSWMKSTGIPAIEDELKSGTALCINMGINNGIEGQAKAIAIQYADYFNANIDKWTKDGAKVYFVSVNPVGQGGGADNYNNIYNSDVKTFNKYVMEYCDSKIKYIDTFSAIYDHFETAEGLHYEKSTSDEIYDLICEGVEKGGSSSGSSSSSGDGGSSNTANRRSARVLRFNAVYNDADKSIAKDISNYLVENVSYDDPDTYVGNYTPSASATPSSSNDKKKSNTKKKSSSSSDNKGTSDTGTGSRFGMGYGEINYPSKYGRAVTADITRSDAGHSIEQSIGNVLNNSSTFNSIRDSRNNYNRSSSSSINSNSSRSSNTNNKKSKLKYTHKSGPITDNMIRYGITTNGTVKTTDKQYDTKNFFKYGRSSIIDEDGTVVYADKAPLQTTPTYHMDTINGKYQKCLRRPKNPYRKGSISYSKLKDLIDKALSVRNRNTLGSVSEYNSLMLKAYNFIMENTTDRTDIPKPATSKSSESKYGRSVTIVNGKTVYEPGDPLTASHISYARLPFGSKREIALRQPRNVYRHDTNENRELQALIYKAIDIQKSTKSVSKYEAKMMEAYEYIWSHNNPDLFDSSYKNTADYKDFKINHPYNESTDDIDNEDEEDDDTSISSSSSGDSSDSSGGSDAGDTIGSFLANTIADSKVGQVVNSFINFNASSTSDDSGSSGDSSGSSGSTLNGKDVRSKTWNWFTNKGYSKAATSGVMGNIEWETFKGTETGVFPGDGEYVSTTEWLYDVDGTGKSAFANDPGGAGLIQWTPWTAVLGPYCKKKAGDEEAWKKDLSLQLGCIHDENMQWINQGTSIGSREEYMKLNDPEEAAAIFEAGVERPGVPSTAKRQGAARWFYDNMEKIGSATKSKDDDDDDKGKSKSGTGSKYSYSVFGKPAGLGTFGRGDTTNSMVWWYLRKMGLSEKGAAGVMGNMQAESGINPMNLQDSYETSLGYTDESYTKAVDKGTYKNFANDSAGYGLVQFTSSNLKQDLYDHVKEEDKSIASLSGQLETLNKQLTNNYSDLLKTLKNAKSVSEASNAFLHNYERPADQSSSVEAARTSLGEKFYEQFKGTEGTEIDDAKVDFGDSSDSDDSDSSSSSSDNGGDTIGSFLSNVLADSKVGQVMNSFINFNASPGSSGGSGGSGSNDGSTGSGSGADIVKVAMKEYEEGNEGDNNKYNEWMWGKGSTLPWCAAFVAWCADQAGISTDVIPKVGECNTMSNGILEGGGKEIDSAKDAKPGDIIFYGDKGGYYHVGIIRDFKNGKLRSVEGNTTYTKGYGEVDIHDDVQQTGIGINRPAYANKKKSSKKDDKEDTDSKKKNNDKDEDTSDTGTGALFGMGTFDIDDDYDDKPIAKYGTFKESIYGTGTNTGIYKEPHPNLASIKKTIRDRDGSTRKIVYSGMDREIARAYKSASRPHTYSKYGKGSLDSNNTTHTKIIDNTHLINAIINILYTIADNTDKLNVIVSILNNKLGTSITPDDIANNSNKETLKSRLHSSLNNLAGTATSKLNTYADTVGDSSINTIIEAMNMIAAE